MSRVSLSFKSTLLLTDYLEIIVNFNPLTTDTMSRVIKFFIAFNSRTFQVVLSAGAMRSAGLKKHPREAPCPPASQSLSVIIVLILYVCEMFWWHLSRKQAVMLVELDKLKHGHQEHQNEIRAKLVAIVGDRFLAHVKNLNAIGWDSCLTNFPKHCAYCVSRRVYFELELIR
ncbi:Vps54-like protein-domain-containing protein [Lactarius akahatsu]|uniref:Vps54-like protein-domain-containing protein n=1 Tax=Lactarius akahatsu TaxID=416441 RepID=A0AAD4LJK1_9AGAM|nr:Vps54-like protein-domain-containing protein [Lactarius akahatsu]